jgi:NAD(P)-dependent dehydrogenase (short-subunit alcohol dehydrogenase family)
MVVAQDASVVLIVGSTQGIGEATAELLAQKGWRVILSGRQEAKGQEVATRIKESGGEAVFIKGDVSTEEGVKSLHDAAISVWGRLDAAVNNAGISNDANNLADSDTSKFLEMIQVNVLGVYWSMKNQVRCYCHVDTSRKLTGPFVAETYGNPRTGTDC